MGLRAAPLNPPKEACAVFLPRRSFTNRISITSDSCNLVKQALIKFDYTCQMLRIGWYQSTINCIISLIIISCTNPEDKEAPSIVELSSNVELEYAKSFRVWEQEEGTYINVNGEGSPDQGYTYLLIKRDTELPPGISINQAIEVPVKNLVVTSTSHIAFLDLLRSTNHLVGFPNTHYVSSTHARSRIEKGLIKDVGTSNGINIESLIELQPELVVHYTSGVDDSDLGLLDQSGIPYVINLDFLEESPLGRAEWIKFMGLLVGKEDLADSIFQSIKMKYLALTNRTDTLLNRPTVFSGVLYGDTWFAPGARSFVASFIRDAGGDYTWDDHRSSGSVELSFEAVLSRNTNSDFWIGAGGFTSKASLYAADNRYSIFQAFQSGQMYNYHGRIGATGGFEYLEQGGARPDIVLADFIKILHPEIISSHQLYFFKRLE